MEKQKYTSIDLFSGCGGLSLGFKMAGVHSILASDIDENCEKNFCQELYFNSISM